MFCLGRGRVRRRADNSLFPRGASKKKINMSEGHERFKIVNVRPHPHIPGWVEYNVVDMQAGAELCALRDALVGDGSGGRRSRQK